MDSKVPKGVFGYMCLCFIGASMKLQGYVDTNLTSDTDSQKSIANFVYTLGGIVWGLTRDCCSVYHRC